ncbi:peroxisome assembly protein 12-A isoform X2 [Sabethes cyaneus]|uniref:peroxisome assembly protein 12-A isoform X2 n=1 Tax=Sabethes cyaneus TaxID=53552 RepID=UPI00237D74BB|nr:peroxisome assembly protein 12-A isoform X2 [Sabethes cyaneus]
MAAKGAHITQNIETRPSIFEVVAADSLNATFYPALKKFLATIKPNTFGYLLRYYDEIYALFNCIVQSYYLRNKGGSLAEIFYGLTRISKRTLSFNQNRERWSLVCLVIAPYFYNKIKQMLQEWKNDYDNGKTISDEKRKFLQLIPYGKALFEAIKLYHCVLYLAGKSSTHSPVLWWLGLTLTYLTEEEESWTLKDVLSGQVKLATIWSIFLLKSLELSAFFLQFIEWWQNEANMGDLSRLPVPEAPETDLNSERYKNICPLCLQKWIVPTAVSVSGYVYCYQCIITYVQQKKQCAVSKYPATINDLVRVFDDDE